MKARVQKYLLALILMLFSTNCIAQYLIEYPAPAQNLTTCYSQSILEVRVTTLNNSISNNQITIDLPPGVEYVFGSIQRTGGTALLDIIENGGTPNQPIFEITPNNIVLSGSFIEFSIERTANCLSRNFAISGGIFKDSVTVSGSIGSISDEDPSINSYNVNFPSLSFNQPPAISNALVGNSYSRNFSIINGADGCADEIFFYIIYPNSEIELTSLILNGFGALIPDSINTDTLFFSLSGAGELTADGLLCNGETLNFTENIIPRACNINTNYAVGWGCDGAPSAWCNTTTGSSLLTMATGSPSLNSNVNLTLIDFVDLCTPFDYTVTFTNNGTGNATAGAMFNVILQHQWGDNGHMDTNFINLHNVEINGIPVDYTWDDGNSIAAGIVSVPTGRMLLDLSQFTTDIDGAGGLDDLDGDGIYNDLPVGESVTIRVTAEWKCENWTTGCPSVRSRLARIGGQLNYNTMCDTGTQIITNHVFGGNTNFSSGPTFDPFVVLPANIIPDVPFRFTIGGSLGHNRPESPGERRYEWRIILPPGVSVAGTGNPLYNDTDPVTYTQVGDTLIVQSPDIDFGDLGIDLVFTCGVSGELVFQYELNYINNVSTGCRCGDKLYCGSISRTVNCPIFPCPGPFTYYPETRRDDNSIGFTDNTLTTRVDPTTIPDINLQHATFLDTVRWASEVVQYNDADNIYFELSTIKTSSGFDQLTPIDFEAEIWRGGVLINTCNLDGSLFSTANSTASHSFYSLEFSSCFPSGQVLDGDSLITVARFVVSHNDELPETTDSLVDGRYLFYNLDPLGDQLSCNEWAIDLYTVKSNSGVGNSGSVNMSWNECGERTGGVTFVSAHSGNPYFQEYEWRPGLYIDSIEVIIPTGYEYVGFSDLNMNITTLPIINGNSYVWINDGTWQAPRFVNSGQNSVFRITLRNSCLSPIGALPGGLPITGHYRDFYWSESVPLGFIPPGTGSFQISETRAKNINFPANQIPTLDLIDLSGTIQAAAPIESFDFRISNTSLSTANYSWMAIPDNPNIIVVQVVELPSNTPLTPIAYPGGIWYQLTATGILSSETRDYRIDFEYTNCTQDSFEVITGWNCDEYPTNPSTYSCDVNSLWLEYIPVSSEVEVIIVATPNNINLCENVTFEYIVNNVQAGNSVDHEFLITTTTGLEPISGSFEIEYPLGSGNWETISESQLGNIYTFDLTQHTDYPINGLPGTLNTAISDERQIGVRFDMFSDCNFTGNTNFNVSLTANASCGDPASGNGLSYPTPSISIIGLNNTLIDLNITVNDTLKNCSNTVEVLLSSTILSSITDASSVLEINLPLNVYYQSGSINCTSANCPTLLSSDTIAEIQTLIFSYPENMSVGEEMNFIIEVLDGLGSICGENQIFAESYNSNATLSCPTSPSGLCDLVISNSGADSSFLYVEKPTLELSVNSATVATPITDNYNLEIEILNSSLINHLNSNSLVVEIFCANSTGNPSGSPISSLLINEDITAGASIIENFSFSHTGCNVENGIVAILSNTDNCICETTEDSFPIDIFYETEIVVDGCDSLELLGSTYFGNTTLNDTVFNSPLDFDSIYYYNIIINNSSSTNESIISCDSIEINSIWYFTSQIITLNETNIEGCDSIHTIDLTLNTSQLSSVNVEACDSVEINGVWYIASSIINDTIIGGASNNCDSIVTYNITINPSSDSTFSSSTSCNPIDTGIFINDLSNLFGCDSVHTLTVSLLDSDSTFASATSCNPIDTGIFISDLSNQFGCDSVHIDTISLLPSDSTFASATSCNPIDTGIFISDLSNQFGCDSVHIDTISLLPSDSTFASATSCNPIDTGIFINDLSNQFGCDSVHIDTIALLPSDSTFTSATSCNPTDTGVFISDLSNQFGCDSVHIDTITLLPSDSTFASTTSCNPIDTGIFISDLSNQFGCDSVHIDTISLLPSDSTFASATSCNPIDTGVFISDLSNQFGCDSVHIDTISLLPSDSTFASATSCNPIDTGIFINDLSNQFGCDSVHIDTIALLPSDSTFAVATSCNSTDTGVFISDLSNQFGCDSVHIDTISLLPSDSTFATSTSCNPIDTGIFISDLSNQFGCDSVHIDTIALLPSDSTFASATSCNPIDTGIFISDLSNQFGCDSVHVETITLLPSDSTFASATSCNPIDTGIFINDLSNQFGCDSVHVDTITLLPSDSTFASATSCNPIDTGIFINDLSNQFGCDSVHIDTITLLPSDSTFAAATSCNPIDTGIFISDLSNQFGCDSVHIDTITLLDSDSTFASTTSCNPIDTGVFINDLSNQFGCDSVHIDTITLLPSDSTFASTTSCNPIDTGIFISDLSNQFGCDSVHIDTITLLPSDSTFAAATSCNPIDTGIFISDLSNQFGCDSVHIDTITLLPSDSTFASATSCNPIDTGIFISDLSNQFGCDSVHIDTISLLPSDSTFATSTSCNPIDTGIFISDLSNQFGCDSVHVETITLLPSDSTFASATSCNPIDTGIFINDLSNQFGCDSVHVDTITLLPSDSTFASATSCNPIDTGIFINDLSNQFGCDSVHIDTITLLPSDSTFASATSCNPIDTGVFISDLSNQFGCDSVHIDTITLLDSDSTFASTTSCNPIDTGVFINDLSNQFGCDSVHIDTITLLPSDSTFASATSCNPIDTGVFISDLSNQFGCDSVHTLTVSLLDSDSTFAATTSCNPIDTGIFISDLSNQFGCDSVHTLTVSLLDSDSTFALATSCNPIDTGIFINDLSNQFGCDSVHIDTITLLPSDSTFASATSCNPIDTGVFINDLINQFGCDSVHVDTINLLPSDSTFASATSCNPIDTGIFINDLSNQFGCDSVHTLTVSLLDSDSTFALATSCNPIDTGIFINDLSNQFGCDSVHILTVTLSPKNYSVNPNFAVVNGGESFEFTIVNEDDNLEFSWFGTNSEVCNQPCDNFTVNPNDYTVFYYFTLFDTSTGCTSFDTLRVDVEFSSELNVPNIFTPNGDGQNDVYRAYGKDIFEYSLMIFDRWGGKLFETSNLNEAWDGSFKGLPVQSGVYLGIIEATGLDAKKYKFSVNIKLVR